MIAHNEHAETMTALFIAGEESAYGQYMPADECFRVGISSLFDWEEGLMEVNLRICDDGFDATITKIDVIYLSRRHAYFQIIEYASESDTEGEEDDDSQDSYSDDDEFSEDSLLDFSDDYPDDEED